MRALIAAALLYAVTPAFADSGSTTGKIAAFDRVSNIIVMEDKTVWQLNANTILPENLLAGEEVTIRFRYSGDNGVTSVDALERL